tara:strand:+ start:285 stop:524 length:240 start_codon:yes stop_codon:yes gene_type:complete
MRQLYCGECGNILEEVILHKSDNDKVEFIVEAPCCNCLAITSVSYPSVEVMSHCDSKETDSHFVSFLIDSEQSNLRLPR